MYIKHKSTSNTIIKAIVLISGGILWALTGNFIFFVLGLSVATTYDRQKLGTEI